VDWIRLSQDRVQSWAFVNTVMKIHVSLKGEEFRSQRNSFRLSPSTDSAAALINS
jgi:hypothetical protein